MIKFLTTNPKILVLIGLISLGIIIITIQVLTAGKEQEIPPPPQAIDLPESDENENAPFVDEDGDGLTTQQENALGTNPSQSDTDNDGISDGEEALQGTDPLKPGETPLTENENFSSSLTLQFYDWRRKNQSTESLSIQKEEADQFLKEKGMETIQIKTLTSAQAGIPIIDRTPKQSELEQHVQSRYIDADYIPEQLASFLLGAQEALENTSVDALPTEMQKLEQSLDLTIYDFIYALDETQKALAKIKTYKADYGQDLANDIAAMQQMRDLLVEISKNMENDPVIVARNIEWANQLLDLSNIYDYIYMPVVETESPDVADFVGYVPPTELPEE